MLACIIHRMPPAHGSQRVVPYFHKGENPFVVPSFHKGGVRGGSCNLTDPQPPNLGGLEGLGVVRVTFPSEQ